MKFKSIISRKRKAKRTIFRNLALIAALWLVALSFAPVELRYEKYIVKNPPVKWREIIFEENDEVIKFTVRDHILKIAERKKVIITAYSSTVDQCDSTPFITASLTRVREGIVASRDYKFGTRILIPKLFGFNKVLVVEDRMNKRFANKDRLDIWCRTRKEAKNFGKKELEIIVLED